jgi:ribonuclease BN (tRNA processing enzyme)
LTVLGSSGGYPGPGSACSGYLVEGVDTRVWIDAGSGTLSRLLGQCSLADLTGLVISHLHADHWTDLPLAIHTLRFAIERDEPLPVHGPPNWLETMGVVAKWALEDEAVFVPHELRERERVEIGALQIEPILVHHSDPNTFGLRITDGAAILAYSADTGACNGLDELARDADLLVCEAGTPEEMETHLTARQAGEVARRAGAGRLLVTHLPPEADREKTLRAAQEAFGGQADLAVEGRTLEL